MGARVVVAWSVVLLIACGAWAEPSPEGMPLPEGKETTIACHKGGGGEEWHYRVWVPQGYNDAANAERTYPVLFVSSPGGNAKMGAMADWIRRHQFLAIMLIEAKNGPWGPIVNNFLAAYADARKRLRINPTLVFGTGFSGGARAVTKYNQLLMQNQCPPMAGVVLQGAGTAGGSTLSDLVRGKVPMAFVCGAKDSNRSELSGLASAIPGPFFLHREFDGGHQWAPKDKAEECLDWVWSLAWQNPRTVLGKADIQASLDDVLAKSKAGEIDDVAKYGWLNTLKGMAARQRLGSDPDGKKIVKRITGELKALSSDPAFRKEMAAHDAYKKIADREEQLLRAGPLNPQVAKKLAVYYRQVAKRHADTEFGKRAAEKADALNAGS